MSDRLRELGVTRVVMEATSEYWMPPFYLLEAQGFEVWLVNAKDVKHLPGRPKTDKLDAVWLCKVAERQMIRPSFVPPPEIRWHLLCDPDVAFHDLGPDYMGQDQTMVVLFKPDREATRSLERSGIADDGRIVFVASSPSRRISLAL